MMQRIVRAHPDASKCAVDLEFADGFKGRVDLGPLIRPLAVTARLGEPGVFEQVRIGSGGRSLAWPGEIDLCADALRQQAVKT